MNKRILFLVIVPFLLILISIFYLNRFNKEQMIAGFEEITIAEGQTIGQLVEISGSHLSEKGEKPLTDFLDRLYDNESIVYIGLFKGDELIYLLSRFEGFFPVVADQEKYRVIDSPMGKIFEVTGQFSAVGDSMESNPGDAPLSRSPLYRLHIGFDYQFLTAFESAASRNFSVVAGVFMVLMLALIGLVIYFDKKFYRKQLELEGEQREKERFKELSLLTSEIAHEIKNPLNSIYLSFNTLETYCSDEETALFYRGAIKNEIKRITGILETYSGLSKEIYPDIKPIEIDELMNEFKLLAAEELKEKNISLDVGFTGEAVCDTDKNLLKQILLNLIKNAGEAGATTIAVAAEVSKDNQVWRVTDNGKGIDADLKESIFKPYTSTKTKGMGLGLHISQRLAQALNGTVELEISKKGQTAFKVVLGAKC